MIPRAIAEARVAARPRSVLSSVPFTVVPATPVHADAIAELMYATGPEVFDFVYGADGRCLDVLRRLCVFPGGLFGQEHTRVACRDGRLLGIEHGFDAATRAAHDAITADHLREFLSREDLRRVAWADEILSAFFLPLSPDAYYIQNLSVLPELRGQGIGAHLLDAAFRRAREAGYTCVELDVSVTNPAVHLYLRAGMEVVQELGHAEYERAYGLKAHSRMVKSLT